MSIKTISLLLTMTCASVFAQHRGFYGVEETAKDQTLSIALPSLPRKDGEVSAELRPSSQSTRADYSATLENGWSNAFSVPGVVDGPVYAMTSDGANLYVGGNFSVAGGVAANNVAKWDGQKWHALGEGPDNGVNATVHAMSFIDGKLFAGGLFVQAGTKRVNALTYFDGKNWNPVSDGDENGVRKIDVFANGDTLISSGFVYAMFIHKRSVVIGGYFHLVGKQKTNGIAAWNIDTQQWETFNGGLASAIPNDLVYAYAFAADGNDLYAGGKFHSAGGVSARNLAKWNGTSWSAVGGGANNWVRGMEVDATGNLYIVGMFDSTGSVRAHGVAKWNKTAWETFGDVYFTPGGAGSPQIKTVCLMNNNLYVGGYFENINDAPAWSIAKWDGAKWSTVGEALGFPGRPWPGGVNAVQAIGNRLYVGGDFSKAGDMFLGSVAYWEETSSRWNKLSEGLPEKGIIGNGISALAGSGNAIYAGGSFSIAGSTFAKSIAKWNGSDWETLGTAAENGITGSVETLLVDGNDVYVGGHFGFAGSVEAYHIAKWDGAKWSAIGIGVGGVSGASVYALEKIDHYLYVGGYFAIVGDAVNNALPANSIARFNLMTNRWEALGNGLRRSDGFLGVVNALAHDGNMLYVGGRFGLADNQPAQNIAVWNQQSWSALGGPGNDGVEGTVAVIKVEANEVLVGGAITKRINGQPFHGFVKWNGTTWQAFGGTILRKNDPGYVMDVITYDGKLIIGGSFDQVGHAAAANLAWWDGAEWHDLGGGTNALVSSLVLSGNRIMIGGGFTIAGSAASVAMAQFDLTTTAVDGTPLVAPAEYALFQNYPNPFNPTTVIAYQIPRPGLVTLKIYDMLGREKRTLVQEHQPAGKHEVAFDAGELASGVYVYRMQVNGFVSSNKMLLVR